ncbi:MAG: anaerobic ribonucleoside-triphosphate reductase activating protein [Cyclobacteriaceae bacterium]
MSQAKPIYSISPFTILDYPDHTACILWFAGCYMRCSYCYNPDIVLGKGKIGIEDAISFLHKRIGLLDGVVFSGGKCTLHKDLLLLAKLVKEKMNIKVKIDTNGSRPEIIRHLLDKKWVDYMALDFKSLPLSFRGVTQSNLFQPFFQSLRLLVQREVSFEVRTTLHSSLISPAQPKAMMLLLDQIGYQGPYYIQHYVSESETLGHLSAHDKKGYDFSFSTANVHFELRN